MPERNTPHRSLAVVYLLLLFLLPACTEQVVQKPYVIGFSQCIDSDLWRKTMLEEMKRELAFHPQITLNYKQADGNSQKQIGQVKQLVQEGIDLLIISPNEAEPLTPIVEEVFRSGIPVIIVDRKINSPLYSAYIGADNYEIGKIAGQYMVQLLNGKGRVMEVTGLPKSSPAVERHKGVADALAQYPDIQLKRINGQWLKEVAQIELNRLSDSLQQFDLLFAQNDMMAIGSYEVYQGRGLQNPKIIGVDGLPGAGLKFIADKKLTATMLYPTGGDEAIQTALKILNKEAFHRENILQTTVIDSTNVRLMQLQASKLTSQQKQIERQQTRLVEQERIYNNQRTFLYIMSITLLLAVSLGGVAFYSLRENRKINGKLHLQNTEILTQKNQIEEMSVKAQRANEAKVNFFTNISHEFRTPLTLILGPLEELLVTTKHQAGTHQSLLLIQKNVIRLLRLFNQLMDFRKMEVDKMKLRASENDLVAFTNDILNSYKKMAHQHNIDLRLITRERQIPLWFDATMLDKVLFNLLSNAFKFTKDNGYIHVYLEKDEASGFAQIRVEDNGIGMSQDALDHAFEAFYQGEYDNYKGSGLGLALSNELIRLHRGAISVRSERWKGTAFEVRLPLGKAHLLKEELAEVKPDTSVIYEQAKIYTSDLQEDHSPKSGEGQPAKQKEYTVLIVEDNRDLRHFLCSKLSGSYEVLEADNDTTALQQAFDAVPDLIICDVVIPGKNGMTLTNIFKSDIRTSHIPVILLTAKTDISQQIEGMRTLADAYIVKPFNVQFLLETVNSMIENRLKLKEHYTGGYSASLKSSTGSKPDRKFVNEFTSLVENNIANENFSVEEICRHMGVSRVQLYRKVKTLMDMNVNDYILQVRIQKAKYLLQQEDLSVGEVAFKVGFSSSTYFSTVFKSRMGVTPKAFKEQ